MRDIHVPHPSGGRAVQIGCPADLSGNPCRNDGPPTLVYNGESSGLGTLILQAPAWPFSGKLELQETHSQAGAWERAYLQHFKCRLITLFIIGGKGLLPYGTKGRIHR